MTDTIKQIDEDSRLLKSFVSDREKFGGATIDEAIERSLLRDVALKRIASGDDWFPIESAPKDGTWILARTSNHGAVYTIKWAQKFAPKYDMPEDAKGWYSLNNGKPIIGFNYWKPLDDAQHIAMLMEEEIEK